MNKIEARPFLKWAGGKNQLLAQFDRYFPERLFDGKIRKYVEPFVGAGAVFFYLNSKFKFDSVVLNDINEELILTYKVIQNNIENLIKVMNDLKNVYLEASDLSAKEQIYYEQRELFNKEKASVDYSNYSEDWLGHAARMIFLNKTCFNGLYRQNRKGGFNVPFGKHVNPPICDEDNLRAVNNALQNVILVSKDFKDLTRYIDNETFVYMDPPYRPLNVTSSFNDYAKIPFNDDSQRQLAEWYFELDNRGAALMLSNSDPKNTNENDNFFEELYGGFNINRIRAARSINSKGTGRDKINELLIINERPLPTLLTDDVAVTLKDINEDEGNRMKSEDKKFTYTKSQETFEYLMDTLKDSINGWSYFVNWTKVNNNIQDVEVQLNILNYLIGKENVEEEFKKIIRKYPETIEVIPILLACREKSFQILDSQEYDSFHTEIFNFKKVKELDEESVDKTLKFAKESGLLSIIKDKRIKSLVDYVYGIEVGLDSNGRKNRSGTAMEELVERYVKSICDKYNYEYIDQATQSAIKAKWNINVTVDKATRRFDFAVNTKSGLCLVEVNYYGGGGSKLKATAGEYKELYNVLKNDGHKFIWITDGKGWLTASKPLNETFEHNEYLLNLEMVNLGVLEKILSE